LKGEYAAYISGVRSFGGITENFVGISLRKYDGNGNFTEEFASFHGAITGNQTRHSSARCHLRHLSGECQLHRQLDPKLSDPWWVQDIVSDFVIMEDAKEVREIVTSPSTNIVSAVFKRKQRG